MKTFFNILPPEKKEDLLLEKRYRSILRQEMGLLFLILFFAGLLLGIWFLLALEERTVVEKNTEKQGKSEAYAQMALYDETFSQMQSLLPSVKQIFENQKEVVWIFRSLEEEIPREISFASVSIEENVLKLTGQADTRDHLLLLQEKLRGTKCFSDVILPWSQMAKKESIDFEITISVDLQCF